MEGCFGVNLGPGETPPQKAYLVGTMDKVRKDPSANCESNGKILPASTEKLKSKDATNSRSGAVLWLLMVVVESLGGRCLFHPAGLSDYEGGIVPHAQK